jgi:WD40 repeat protein
MTVFSASPPFVDRRHGNDWLPQGISLRHTLEQKDRISRLAWAPDGQRLASPSFDRTIRIWDTQIGQPRQILTSHDNLVTGVSWSPDGQRLASSSDDKTVRIWDVDSGERLFTPLKHEDIVTGVAWSPDGQLLASSSDDKIVYLWNAHTGELIKRLESHTDRVLYVAWSPTEPILASASWDGTIRFWNGHTGEEIQLHLNSQNEVKIFHLAWSHDGRMLASACFDKTVRIWEAATGKPLAVLECPSSSVLAVSFSHDGRILASKSLRGTIRLWRYPDWKTVSFHTSSGEWPYTNLAFHPSAPVLAALGQSDHSIYIFDLDFDKLYEEPDQSGKEATGSAPGGLFISYSHKDEKWLQTIQTCLRPLTRDRTVQTWSDQDIKPGAQWEREIESALASASAALLLVTPHFLASDFIMNRELPILLQAAEKRGLKLLWIAVSPSLYDETEIQHYHAMNDPSSPLDTLEETRLGAELVNICKKIKAAMQ